MNGSRNENGSIFGSIRVSERNEPTARNRIRKKLEREGTCHALEAHRSPLARMERRDARRDQAQIRSGQRADGGGCRGGERPQRGPSDGVQTIDRPVSALALTGLSI